MMNKEETNAHDVAAQHVGNYIGLQAQIDVLQAEQAEERAAIMSLLFPEGVKAGVSHKYAGLGEVCGVKGQTRSKLERAELAKRGVSAEDLDAATTVTESAP